MHSGQILIYSAAFFLFIFAKVSSHIEFTNLVCESFDKNFLDFDYCHLKSVNRTYKYGSIRLKLLQVPVTNITMRGVLFQKANGYKPFLYNVSVDVCKFLKSNNNPLTKFVFNIAKEHTNMNHTCPYNHDLIVEKLDTKTFADKISRLPFPTGEYAAHGLWSFSNIHRANIKLFLKIYE